jgi:DNA polymerase-4
LSDVRQESLFPELEAQDALETDHSLETSLATLPPVQDAPAWRVGDDVAHPDLGHGWVQGAGHGVVTIRFETRGSGPGHAKTFPGDAGDLTHANPTDSLDWPDYVDALRAQDEAGTSAPAVDDVADR